MIKIIDFYYRDNSKFLDTLVHYIKHAGVIVYRAILEYQNPENMHNTFVIIYRDKFHYRDNFTMHYRDIGFSIIARPSGIRSETSFYADLVYCQSGIDRCIADHYT